MNLLTIGKTIGCKVCLVPSWWASMYLLSPVARFVKIKPSLVPSSSSLLLVVSMVSIRPLKCAPFTGLITVMCGSLVALLIRIKLEFSDPNQMVYGHR